MAEQLPLSVIALAGRRVDTLDASVPRFALGDVDLVAGRVSRALQVEGATIVVASAAAGADLLGLREAVRLGAQRTVILPFDLETFRAKSVADRPVPLTGEHPRTWVELYQSMLATAAVETLPGTFADEHSAYIAVNEEILQRALALGGSDTVAIIVWDGKPRGESDYTHAFAQRARELGIRIREVSTRP